MQKPLIFFFIIFSFGCTSTYKNTKNLFVGQWKMDSFWQQDSLKNWQIHPWMKEGTGRLLYANNGYMSIHITPKNYNTFTTESRPIYELFNQDPFVQTLANYVYTGTYEIIGTDSIVHYRETHGNPNYADSSSKKQFEFDADTLKLFSSMMGNNYLIKWVKSP